MAQLGPLTQDVTAIWVRSDQGDLADRLDAWLLDREESGEIAQLRTRWLGAGAGPRAASPVSALLAATAERLPLMPFVAAAKQRAGKAVEDPAQEERVIAASATAVATAAREKRQAPPDRAWVEAFFRAHRGGEGGPGARARAGNARLRAGDRSTSRHRAHLGPYGEARGPRPAWNGDRDGAGRGPDRSREHRPRRAADRTARSCRRRARPALSSAPHGEHRRADRDRDERGADTLHAWRLRRVLAEEVVREERARAAASLRSRAGFHGLAGPAGAAANEHSSG